MRKRILLILLPVYLFTGGLVASNGESNPNLIENSDLELWSGSSAEKKRKPTGFSFNSNADGSGFYAQSSETEGYGGTGRSLRLSTINSIKSGQATFTTSNIVFPESDYNAEHCYEFSFYGKGHGRLEMLRFDSQAANSLITFINYVEHDDWVRFSGSFLYTPTATAYTKKMQVRLYDFRRGYFYFDEMSVVKLPNNLATIRSIGLKDPISEYGAYLADFDPEVFDYTVDLPYYVNTVPEFLIDPMNKLSQVVTNYQSIKRFGRDEKVKELIINVTSKDGTETREYKITFNRYNYLLSGYSDTFSNLSRESVAESENLSAYEVYNSGDFFGAYSIRPADKSVTTNNYLVTTKLQNGAKTISFKTGKYTGNTSDLNTAQINGVTLRVRISYTVSYNSNTPKWIPIGEHFIDLTKDEWKRVEFNIDSPSPNTQVKIEYVCDGTSIPQFALDDISITPYQYGPLHGQNWIENDYSYALHKLWNLSSSERYSYDVDTDEHRLWVYKTDASFNETSDTSPRCELRIKNNYTSGNHQFEADYYILEGSHRASIMQVWHGFQLIVSEENGGSLYCWKYNEILAENVFNKWIHLNIVHMMEEGNTSSGGNVYVYINGELKTVVEANIVSDEVYFKCGVYASKSDKSEIRIRNIKIYEQDTGSTSVQTDLFKSSEIIRFYQGRLSITSKSDDVKVSIYDTMGKKILATSEKELDITQKGVLIVKVMEGDVVTTRKIVN